MVDSYALISRLFEGNGIVKQHIESFNYFINNDIKHIVEANNIIDSDIDPNFFLSYMNVEIGMPNVEESMISYPITPHQCRLRDLTYSAPILVDIQYVRSRQLIVKKGVYIGRIPIMLKSDRCVLGSYQKSIESYSKSLECPLDPGGYFIINGTEKVILIQEQLSKNRIIIEKDRKNQYAASITSATHEKKSKAYVVFKNDQYFLRHNSLIEDIPIVVAIKATGLVSDASIIELSCNNDKRLINIFSPSLEEAVKLNITTQNQALDYIGIKVKTSSFNNFNHQKLSLHESACDLLSSVIIPNIQSSPIDMHAKGIYITQIIKKLLSVALGLELCDDRDYVGNKRLELAGQLIALLFEDCFKRFNSELKRNIDKILSKQNRAQEFDAFSLMKLQTNIITVGLERAIATGNWNVRRFKMERAGITQVLSRLSYIAALGMMTRITSQFEKTRKISGPRSLQPSQWGLLCPSDTPEGEACGLVKNLSLLAHVTTEVEFGEECISFLLYSLGVIDICNIYLYQMYKYDGKVFLNGRIIGVTQNISKVLTTVREIRRAGLISPLISASLTGNILNISSDNGRLCRPLILISENGEMKLTNEKIKASLLSSDPISFFTSNGCIEYVDTNEESDLNIALRLEDIKPGFTTHLEIHPFTILGAVAGIIPFPDHNQSPRNTYQCAMGKQAIGAMSYNQFERYDSLLYLLVYPQKPLAQTKTIKLINYDRLPAGQNAIVAIMSYSGYDIEDALILNRFSLDRGFGRVMVMKKSGTILKKYSDGRYDRIVPGELDTTTNQVATRFNILDTDGIASPGEILNNGDVYINKQIPLSNKISPKNSAFTPAPISYKSLTSSFVDKVLLSTNDDQVVIKTLIRQTRRPEIGDKFSSRHGQKGVCGLIVPATDMPFCDNGVSCDIIMNPHGFPSRMTIGKMLELITGKTILLNRNGFNINADASIFSEKGDSLTKYLGEQLVQAGFNYYGKDYVTSGITGEPLEAYIYFGPVYYQRLKHMVSDKMHARARGPRAILTRQPTEGRSRDGGLRMGEMERDCLIGYGSSNLIVERLMNSSDSFEVSVCSSCGIIVYKNWCNGCNSCQNVYQLNLPYACKLLFQELISMNVIPRLSLKNIC